jgi:hypothetical protein
MNRKNLERSWEVARQHLNAAKSELPTERLAGYEDWLSHNELELAFDELEAIGNEAARSRTFWSELLAAAKNMRLRDRADRCRKKLRELDA